MMKSFLFAASFAIACVFAVVASLAIAETQNSQAAGQSEFKLPPGWDEWLDAWYL